jgi:hypothetical protein
MRNALDAVCDVLEDCFRRGRVSKVDSDRDGPTAHQLGRELHRWCAIKKDERISVRR